MGIEPTSEAWEAWNKNLKALNWRQLADQGRNQKMNQEKRDSIEIGDGADRAQLG